MEAAADEHLTFIPCRGTDLDVCCRHLFHFKSQRVFEVSGFLFVVVVFVPVLYISDGRPDVLSLSRFIHGTRYSMQFIEYIHALQLCASIFCI